MPTSSAHDEIRKRNFRQNMLKVTRYQPHALRFMELMNLLLSEIQPSSSKFNRRIIEKSDVSSTLVKSLALLESDLKAKISVLSVLQEFAKNSG